MEITITPEKKKEYLLVESKGVIETREDLLGHARLVYDEITKVDAKKILVDLLETQLLQELSPYFDLVKSYIEISPPEVRTLKIAVVVDKRYDEIAASWESLCVSRGLQYFAFTSVDEARHWLISQKI